MPRSISILRPLLLEIVEKIYSFFRSEINIFSEFHFIKNIFLKSDKTC